MQFKRDDKSAKQFSSFFVGGYEIRPLSFLCSFLACVAAFSWDGPLASGQSPSSGYGSTYPSGHPDRNWIEQLLESRLYDVAIEITQQRMTSTLSNRNTNENAQWLFLWMESKMALAASQIADAYESPAKLDSVLQEIQTAVADRADDPRTLWIQYKVVWCQWYLLRSAVAGYLAAPTRRTIRDWSLQQIRKSLEALESLEQKIAQTPTKNLPSARPSGIDMPQFRALQADTNLLECDLLYLRAMMYPTGSDERIAAGTQMVTTIDDAEKQVGFEWVEKPKLSIARSRAFLLLSRPQEAVKAMEGLYDKLPNERLDWRVQVSAVAAEGARAIGKISDSDAWIQRVGGWDSHPVLAIEYFANRLSTTDPSNTKSLQRVLEIKKAIADRFGGYWASRADALLVASQVKTSVVTEASSTNSTANVSLELLRAEVKQLIAAKKWLPAIEKLGQAEMAASNQSNLDQALELAMQGAALWGIQRNYLSAGNEFQRAAVTYSKAANAPKSAMHAIAMLQQRANQIEKEGSLSDSDKKVALEEVISQQKIVWSDTLSIWPETEQATASLQSLEEHFLATDQLAALVELWMQRTERLHALMQTKNLLPSNDVRYQGARDRSIVYASLLSIQLQSGWIDSTLVGGDGSSKRDKLTLLASECAKRFEKLADSAASAWVNEWFTHRNGLGWEWPTGSLRSGSSNESSSIILLWGECEWAFQKSLLAPNPVPQTAQEFSRQVDSLTSMLTDEYMQKLGPQFRQTITRSLELYQIAIELRKDPSDATKVKLLEREKIAGRDPFWIYYSARLLSQTSSEHPAVLTRYRQLAAGYAAGSTGWLECRARTCQILRAMGKTEEASTLAKLVLATYSQLDPVWKTRFGGN